MDINEWKERGQWKEIYGYKDYLINTLGETYSTKNGIILKPRINNRGYLRVRLSINNKQKEFLSHRLVALNFIPNPENKPQVNHIDEDKTNNCIENLEWNTPSENMLHGVKKAVKRIKNFETKPTTRGYFKQVCVRDNLDFDDFIETFVEKRGKVNRYCYKYRIGKK